MTYIVVDLDGTLADNSHRAHLAEAKKWDEFHEAMGDDEVYPEVKAVLTSFFDSDGPEIVFLTARSKVYREETMDWLHDKAGQFGIHLIMRDRPHHEETAGDFKLRKLKDLEAEYGCKPLFCLEDQMNITLQLRAAGYTVWNVRNSHA